MTFSRYVCWQPPPKTKNEKRLKTQERGTERIHRLWPLRVSVRGGARLPLLPRHSRRSRHRSSPLQSILLHPSAPCSSSPPTVQLSSLPPGHDSLHLPILRMSASQPGKAGRGRRLGRRGKLRVRQAPGKARVGTAGRAIACRNETTARQERRR